MTPNAKAEAEKVADKIVEKSRKRWIEESEEGFGVNLDILSKELVYELLAFSDARLEEAARKVQTFKWATDNDSEITELLAHRMRGLKSSGGAEEQLNKPKEK